MSAWLRLFKQFLLEFEERDGSSKVHRSTVASLDVCLEFLAEIVSQHKGRTRVVAAARALDFVRAIFGWSLLKTDPRTALLKRGVLRLHPHKPRGAVPFPAVAMAAIGSKWGRSQCWWKRMVATIIVVAFVALLRGAGILSIPRKGVTWVVHQHEFMDPPVVPGNHTGVLLLLPFRKSSQTQPSWVPLQAGLATSLLSRYVRWRRRHAKTNSFLFPSRPRRYRGKNRTWSPNRTNPLSTSSLCSLMRKALHEVCGLSAAQAARFTVHALRVGGINYYRSIGVPIGMRALIASHKSLVTSRRYLRLLPAQQIQDLANMVGR